jgi:integrase
VRAYGPATVRARLGGVRRAETALGDLSLVTPEAVAAWLNQWPSPSTRAAYAGHIRAWCRWAGVPDPTADMRLGRTPPVPRPVPTETVHAAMTGAPARTRVWVGLMAYAGLRATEVTHTGPQHVAGHRLYLPVVKGGGDGWVTLPTWFATEVAACAPWHVSVGRVRSVVRARLAECGGGHHTPHALRHHYATALLAVTDNMRDVQTALRHRSITSTAIYTAVSLDRVAAAAEHLPPPPSR